MPSIRIGTTFSRATAPTMPHMSSAFLRTFPAALRDLHLLVEDQRLGRHVFPDGRTRSDRGAATDRHRRDELRIRSDVHVVFDDRAMLRGPIVVAGDRPGAEIDVASDDRIADVGEMI